MPRPTKNVGVRLLLLAMLQGGCLVESEPVVAATCGPRDLTPECCLKRFPGQVERCTGLTDVAPSTASLGTRTLAAGLTVAVALQPVIGTAEQQGAALAADLLRKVEDALVQCTRKADQQVNDYHFKGKSPTPELCSQLKLGEKTTWAAYLGLFKHEQAWPCLREALERLLPGRYLLHPRFQLKEQTGKWDYVDDNRVKDIIAQQGWKGLTGTIEPDVVLMDEQGLIVRVYDLKFPCPATNDANWTRYMKGPWYGSTQEDIYSEALQVEPRLVSPRQGIVPSQSDRKE